jgi:hypothetical protein
MAPVEPLEHREWAVIGGCKQRYRFKLLVSRSKGPSAVPKKKGYVDAVM